MGYAHMQFNLNDSLTGTLFCKNNVSKLTSIMFDIVHGLKYGSAPNFRWLVVIILPFYFTLLLAMFGIKPRASFKY
jgi:hypothetical protein